MLTVLVSIISNSQVFLLKKSEQLLRITFFSSKNISLYAIFNDQSFNDTLTNDILSFEQLGPNFFYFFILTVVFGGFLKGGGHKFTKFGCFYLIYQFGMDKWSYIYSHVLSIRGLHLSETEIHPYHHLQSVVIKWLLNGVKRDKDRATAKMPLYPAFMETQTDE